MGCLAVIILVFGSRAGLIIWWISDPQRFILAFQNWALPGTFTLPVWIWPLAGAIFLPWTTLAYLFLFQGGITGFEWIIMVIALLFDLAGHGGGYYHRNRISNWRGN